MNKWLGGIAAAVLTGVLTYWLTEGFRRSVPNPPQEPDAPRTEPPSQRLDAPQPKATLPTSALSSRAAAEIFSREYASRLLRGRIDSVLRESSAPFYLNGELLSSLEELRFRYEHMDRSGRGPSQESLESQSMSVADYRARIQSSPRTAKLAKITDLLQLGDDAVVVLLASSDPGLNKYRNAFLFRRSGSDLKMAGLWEWEE